MPFDPLIAAGEASTAAAFERAALEGLQHLVGFDVAFFGLPGASLTGIGLSSESLERAMQPGSPYEAELAPVKRAALAGPGVAVDTEIFGEARVRQAAYFRDLARPLGGKHSLLAYLVLRGRVIGGLMLARTGGPFRASDLARVAEFLPALSVGRASYGLPGLGRRFLPPSTPRSAWSGTDRVLARRVTGDTEIRVRDARGYREMIARDRRSAAEMTWTRAALEDAARSGWPYVDLVHVAAALARRRERALFLGCGGAVGARQFAVCYPGIEIDIVEPEPAVVELAREFFGLNDLPRVAVHAAEGAAFLEGDGPSWDVIVVDAYGSGELGDGLSGRSFFRALRRRLRPGGAFAFNVVGALDGSGPVRSLIRRRAPPSRTFVSFPS